MSDVIDDILAERDLWVDHGGWLHAGTTGPRLYLRPMHSSWYYATYAMRTPTHGPDAVVVHYTADPSRGVGNIVERRTKRRKPWHPETSWHLTIDRDGTLYQSAPLDRGTWHAGAGDWNWRSIGIEFIGNGTYTEAQVRTAIALWPALVHAYGIPEERAFVHHSSIKRGKPDPGPEWARDHEPRVRAAAFG